jgi:MoaA/NifB/PqqE/SkfB family radical SAM enzyme
MGSDNSQNIIGNSADKDLYKQGYLSIFIEVTSRCNLNCKYCYASSSFNKEPTLENFKKIISKCEAIPGIRIFYEISGGELLLRPDWEEICRLFLSTGKEVYLYSNATLVTEKIAEKMQILSNQFDGRLKFCSSLDSHLPEIHNSIRGKYKEVIRGFELLKNRGIKLKICVMLTSRNAPTIYETVNFIVKNYSKEIMLAIVRPTFKITEKNKNLFVSYEKMIEISKNLTEKAKKESWRFFCTLNTDGKAYCKAAKDRIFINPEGNVTPCCFLRQKKDVLGNIYEDPLCILLNRIEEFNKDRDERILLCEHLQDIFGEPPVRMEVIKNE